MVIVKRELFLKANRAMHVLHLSVVGLLFVFATTYEISQLIWDFKYGVDGGEAENCPQPWLISLAVLELCYNLSNVATVTLLGYMMDKMTDEAEDKSREPILGLEVPFFVHLASVKLMNEHLARSEAEIAEDVVSQGQARSIAPT